MFLDFTGNNSGSLLSVKNCAWDTTVGHTTVLLAGSSGE